MQNEISFQINNSGGRYSAQSSLGIMRVKALLQSQKKTVEIVVDEL